MSAPDETIQEGTPAEPAESAEFRANVAANLARFAAEGQGGESAVAIAPTGPAWPDWAPAVPDLDPLDSMAAPLVEADPWAAAERPASRPEDYQLPGMHHSHDDASEDMLAEAVGVRALLFHAALPAAEGSALLYEIAQVAKNAVEPPDDVAFELQVEATHKTLRNMMGDAEFARCSAALEKLRTDAIARLPADKREALEQYLDDNAHLVATPVVLHKLLLHAGKGRRR